MRISSIVITTATERIVPNIRLEFYSVAEFAAWVAKCPDLEFMPLHLEVKRERRLGS